MCALKDKKNKEDNSNVVYQIKCNECDSVHDINFENVEILANCNRRNVRLFLEASFSKANSLSINRHLEIPPYYNEIINKYAKI